MRRERPLYCTQKSGHPGGLASEPWTRCSAPDADRPGELGQALQDVGDAPDEVDGRRALLEDAHRDLPDAQACPARSDHELAGEHVLLDDAIARDGGEPLPHEGLEAMGVGTLEPERRPEQAIIELA